MRLIAGFCLVRRHAGHGYAKEAAAGWFYHCAGNRLYRLKRVLATTRLDNAASIKVLVGDWHAAEQVIFHPDGDRELNLFAIDLT